MSQAQIAVFAGPGKEFTLCSHPLPPRLFPGELLVAVELATICGSDLHTTEGRRKEPTPCILGHEGVGRVLQAGPGRDPALVGARITWTLADSCGECVPCSEWNLPQKCTRLFKYGHAALTDGSGLNGCYASHLILRGGTTVLPVPDELPAATLAPANCALATMVHAVELLPRSTRVVVIQGAGLLGLYGVALLRHHGMDRVVVVDGNRDRLEAARAFGGIPCWESARHQVVAGRADAVIEVAGTSAVVPEGLDLLRPGGHYVFVGMVHPGTPLSLTGERVVRACLHLHGIHNYAPHHLVTGLRFLTASSLPWPDVVSPPFPLERLGEAFALARQQRWARVAVRPL